MNMKNIRKNALSIVCVFVFTLFLGLWMFNILFPFKYGSIIEKYATAEGVDCDLVASVIKVESGFRSDVVSRKGAVGLMQILPSTAKWMCEQNGDEVFVEESLYDPEKNISIGVKYLAYLFSKYENEDVVLACYNAGEGVVRSWMGENMTLEKTQIQFKETEKYIQKVQNLKKIYKMRF